MLRFDSDTMLLTNHPLLVETAEKNYDLFKVSTNLVESTKSKRYYTPEQQADLDIKTSVNKIGEIINLSQELQTLMWHKLNNGATFEDVKELYYDACQLNAMSGIEIDSAKKEFDINNETELKLLRKKWERRDSQNRYIKPYFFGHVDKTKGYYNPERRNYMKHDTSMDYLREILEAYRAPYVMENQIPFMDIIDFNWSKTNTQYRKVNKILYEIDHFKKTSYYIWNGYAEVDDKFSLYNTEEEKMIDSINQYSANKDSVYCLLKKLTEKGENTVSELVLRILFNIGNSQAFELIKESQKAVEILQEDENGEVTLFSKKYKKNAK